MRSLNHEGTFFDRLFFSNFGYGGDPQNVSRLNISKNKWYNFSTLFRRNEYAWDHSLLANPLNPVTPAFANAPPGFTPIISTSPQSEEHTSELQSQSNLVCRLLLEKK